MSFDWNEVNDPFGFIFIFGSLVFGSDWNEMANQNPGDFPRGANGNE